MKSPVSDRMAAAEKRLGKTTKGTAEKAKPSMKITPSGTKPGRKQVGVKLTAKW